MALTCIICGALIMKNVKSAGDINNVDFDHVIQISEDWTSLPFVEIFSSNVGCEPGDEHVFNYEWAGTVTGCVA